MVLISVVLLSGNLYAQERTITGTVTIEKDGTTIPAVNITIKGSNTGTVTDMDGKYSIQANTDDTLIASFIGFQTHESLIGNQDIVNFKLLEDVNEFDEVIVIGYGIQKKKLVTGATSQVKGEKLSQRNTTSALQALQGQAAGVNITSTSGQPGESFKMTIRGLGTIGNATPLFIVDGVQTGDISYLNPSDIESMDVLKDAASAAIYGSRGANGVVLITTRSGRMLPNNSNGQHQSQVTFDAYYGLQSRAKKIRMLNTEEYAGIMNEQHLNSGGSTNNLPFDLNNLPIYTSNGVANTNWLDEMFVDDAVTQNYVVGATGGSEYSSYSMSLSYTGQEGIVGGKDLSDYNRYSARINSEHRLYNGVLTIGENFTFSYVENKGISVGNQYSNSLRGAFNTSPLLPNYNDHGDFFNSADETILDQNGNTYWNNQEANPYASMYNNNQNAKNSQKLIGNIYAEINILKNLKFRSLLGVDYHANESRTYTPIYQLSIYSFNDFSKASQNMAKGLGLNLDNLLTYNLDYKQHHFDAMAGMSVQKYKGSWMFGENINMAFDDLDHAWLDNATNTDNATFMKIEGAPYDENKMLSYFGRVQYDFNETYMFNATFRADGSSMFAKNNRWGYFPSVSAGWVISNESFLEGITNTMSFMKLRASWGQNGSSSIDAFQYLAPIRFTNATYNFGGEEGVNTTGSYPSRLSNEELKWETSEQLNFGFDSRLLNNHILLSFDWYRKLTKDWLLIAPVYATAGTDAPYINGGNVINSGVELSLTYNGEVGDFQYQFNAVGSYNKNNVTDIPTEDGIIHGATNTLYANSSEFYRAESGHAIGYFWGWETDGIFQTTAEVNEYTGPDGKLVQPKAKPGDLRYVDQNGDGVIGDDDKVDLGDPNPDFIYGLNFSCTYKGIDFLIITNGVAGNQIVQSYRSQGDKYANYSTDILDSWSGPGTSNTIPRVTNNNINYKFSDIFVKNGSYYRISNVTLGYDITNIVKIKSISQFRVYASVQNLYTFTKYSGMDPEVGYGFDNGATDKFSSGIDLGFYPQPRTFLVGVNIKF